MSFSFLIIMDVYRYTYVQFNSIFKEDKSSLKSLEIYFSDEELLEMILTFREGDRWLFSFQIIIVLNNE